MRRCSRRSTGPPARRPAARRRLPRAPSPGSTRPCASRRMTWSTVTPSMRLRCRLRLRRARRWCTRFTFLLTRRSPLRFGVWRGGARGARVHRAAARTPLGDAWCSAAVVLCPAKGDEPFGMLAAEAQACGTPVVAFRRGALEEVVVEGLTGLLVAPGDIGAAAEASERARGLSRAECRRHAESHFDLELSLDAHERLYGDVAAGGAEVASGG